MPKDVADWTTAVGAPWVPVGTFAQVGLGGNQLITLAVPPETQTLGIEIPTGTGTLTGLKVTGVTTNAIYLPFSTPFTSSGWILVPVNAQADSTYNISWNGALGAPFTVAAFASPLTAGFPTLGQQGMAISQSVAIAVDQSAIPISAAGGLDVDANLDEVAGVAVSLGAKTGAASIPVVLPNDVADVPVKTGAGGDLGVNLDKYGGTATTLGQKVAASSAPVVIASDQTAIPVTTSGTSDVDANIDEVGGVAFSLGPQSGASSLPVVVATDQLAVPIKLGGVLPLSWPGRYDGQAYLNPATGSKATVTLAASSTKRWVAHHASGWAVQVSGAASLMVVSLIDGASGGPAVLWSSALALTAAANTVDRTQPLTEGRFANGAVNTAMTLEFGALVVGVQQAISLGAYLQ
jgi:hypothetical protein